MYTKASLVRLFSVVCLMSMIGITSCKKNDDTRSQHELVSGTWQLTQVGPDANSNGIMESSEISASAPTGFSALITLNSDGTGGAVYTKPGVAPDTIKNMKWDLVDNDGTLRTIDGTDTAHIIIHHVDAVNLTVLDTETTPSVALWEVFLKQ